MILLIKAIFAIGISLALGIGGFRKNSLSLSGALSGIAIGFIHAISSFAITVSLFTFFVLGSLMTNFAKHEKKQMDGDFKEGGQRNCVQVISNSFCSTMACLVYIFEVGVQLYDIPVNYQSNPIGSICMIAAISGLAASCGDTFASEIGSVLSRSNPRLVLEFKKVPRGTNGAVSIVGTLASGLGGFLVGITSYGCICFSCNYLDLHDAPPQWPLIIIATLAGLIGSLIDSILGSSLQFSGMDLTTGKIVNSPGPNVRFIAGHDFLDNHNVNLISSTCTGAAMAFGAFYLWPLLQNMRCPFNNIF